MQNPRLILIPAVPLWQQGDTLIFNRIFYDSLVLIARLWPGEFSCIISLSQTALPPFGVVRRKADELPVKCQILAAGQKVAREHLQSASMVLAAADIFNQLHISALCRQMHIKCVYIIEFIPETRYQITALSTKIPLIKLRRWLFVWQRERERRAAFELCDGLQACGVPAYTHYGWVRNSMMYFETRAYAKDMVTLPELERRLDGLANPGRALRLAFAGRLVAIKGADHLVKLALLLKQRSVPFHFTIYGTGDLEGSMRNYIQRHHLEDVVSMPGPVDFYTQLLPDFKEKVDLFVCLHRQSDPAGTYLETLSCGVPIAGYANRALAGILEQADVGWSAPLDNLAGVATIIERLNQDRAEIAFKSKNSISFARQHDFETTCQNRVDHLLSLL